MTQTIKKGERADACNLSALNLLAEIERRGITAYAIGQRLELDSPGGILDPDLRPALVEHRHALMAVLRLRHAAREQVLFDGVILPGPRFWRVWRAACEATGLHLNFDGQSLSERPRNRMETRLKITCNNAAPRNSLF